MKSGFANDEDRKAITRQIRDRVIQVKRDRDKKQTTTQPSTSTTQTVPTTAQSKDQTGPNAIQSMGMGIVTGATALNTQVSNQPESGNSSED